jgi:hypothetical protein
MGQGPRTGRSLGFCSGNDSPGYTKGFGGRMNRGAGFGRGRGRRFGNTSSGVFQGTASTHIRSKEDEIKLLKSEANALRQSFQAIEKRLEELTNNKV